MFENLKAKLMPGPVEIFPPIDHELEPLRHLLKGKVLNIGAGKRDIRHLIDGELTNQDIPWENESRADIQVYSPIHRIPVADDYFDTILCNAVLEHVENPEEGVAEMRRVLKKGGHLILSVPFLQPEHKTPTDFQRYTKDGLVHLVTKHGLRVLEVRGLFSVYQTVYWIVREWLNSKNTFGYKVMRVALLPFLAWRCKRSKTFCAKIASGHQVIATK